MAAEEKKEEAAPEAATAAPESPSGGGNKLVLILTVVNMFATLGMVGVLFISFQKDHKKPQLADISTQESHEEKGKEGGGHGEGGEGKEGHGGESGKKQVGKDFGKKIQLEQFSVNLSTAGTVNPKFARVSIVLEVPSGDLETEVTQKMAQVRNAIIDLFNSKKPTDLATTEGKSYLKEEIRNAINSFLVTGKVSGVFFTNFAVSG
jgi:flagellar FliL protein